MKNPYRKLMLLGAAASLAIVGGCGGGGGGADDDTPEAAAFRYRQAVMRLLAAKMGPIGAMSRGEVPTDEEVFAKNVNDLLTIAGMIPEGFGADVSNVPAASAALPEVWTSMDDFSQRAADLQMAVEGLAAAVASGGFASGQGLVQSTAGNCGACHRNYRQRDE
ncbi:c-type cytochrome [Candidatus Rariloculus sp.]|uniref:c-type cytochrome n=1 Tax=Candidatus Rariloculus sp. TaxID=3101265 RepID=UPI003D09F964